MPATKADMNRVVDAIHKVYDELIEERDRAMALQGWFGREFQSMIKGHRKPITEREFARWVRHKPAR